MSGVARVTTAKKPRRRGGLGPSAHEERYAQPSQTQDYYLGGARARSDTDGRAALAASRRGSHAQTASRSAPLVSPEPPRQPLDLRVAGEGLAADRRSAIRYLYEGVFGLYPIPEFLLELLETAPE